MGQSENRWAKWSEFESTVRKCVARRARQSADVEDVVSETMVKFIEAEEDLNLNQTLNLSRDVFKTHYRLAGKELSMDEMMVNGRDFSADEQVSETRLDIKVLAEKWFDFMRTLDTRDRIILDAMTRRTTVEHAASTLQIDRTNVWRRRKHIVRQMSAFYNVPEQTITQELALSVPHHM
ncbi:MAG: sigma-70 RNA polymerase sigma factor region 4 domain-containing protein [Thermodesulfovibrionales bacterium]